MRETTEWGVRLPDGTVRDASYEQAAREIAAEARERLVEAGSTEIPVVVTRTRTITYSDWTEVV